MGDLKRERILDSAYDVLKKYGYKRVSMNDIAEAAGISRPGLYLYFSSKEEIFNATVLQRCERKIAAINESIDQFKTTEDKVMHAFEVWTIDHFDETLKSLEAKEMSDSAQIFARASLNQGYELLQTRLASLLKAHFKSGGARRILSADKTADVLVGSLRGFKLVATSASDLRRMVRDLLKLVLT